jgi:pyridoxine/pyridoxamine 5'-phosphate oxidase
VNAEPRRSRPGFGPQYGVAEGEAGMLEWSWAEERLERSRNYWVSTTNPDGRPSVAPVWGLWLDGAVVFGTNARSRKGRNLERDPRAVVHLESGDEVVILHGEVKHFAPDERTADAYEAKYAWRPETKELAGPGWYRLRPRRALAWIEQDYPETATRFDFDRVLG